MVFGCQMEPRKTLSSNWDVETAGGGTNGKVRTETAGDSVIAIDPFRKAMRQIL
jgi:hypothetical protein